MTVPLGPAGVDECEDLDCTGCEWCDGADECADCGGDTSEPGCVHVCSELDEEVETAMEQIRGSLSLTTEQPRVRGIVFLTQLAERCQELAGELLSEAAKMELLDGEPRRSPQPCSRNCPGWAVFDTSRGFAIQRCDDCWSDVPDAPEDGYYVQQLSCQLVLAQAREQAS